MRTTLLLLSLAGVALVTGCNGCSNERYYCDATGCYSCDGIGCREVSPPDPDPCFGDYQCADGESCTVDGCIPSCTSDEDCPRGTVCDTTAHLCLAPGETPPADKPGVCTRNADCPSPPEAICVDGLCQRSELDCGAESCDCSADEPCESGFVCADGQCLADSATCHFDTDCGANRTCIDGLCFAECGGAVTCATGFSCVDGGCKPDMPPTNECTTNDQCATDEVCVDSTCVPGCTADANCPTGYYCSSMVCVVDTRPKPFCSANTNCAQGRSCIDGVCRQPCDTDTQCQMVSGTVPFCRNHVCVTSNEANSNCITSVDCAGSNIECVDGVCQ